MSKVDWPPAPPALVATGGILHAKMCIAWYLSKCSLESSCSTAGEVGDEASANRQMWSRRQSSRGTTPQQGSRPCGRSEEINGESRIPTSSVTAPLSPALCHLPPPTRCTEAVLDWWCSRSLAVLPLPVRLLRSSLPPFRADEQHLSETSRPIPPPAPRPRAHLAISPPHRRPPP